MCSGATHNCNGLEINQQAFQRVVEWVRELSIIAQALIKDSKVLRVNRLEIPTRPSLTVVKRSLRSESGYADLTWLSVSVRRRFCRDVSGNWDGFVDSWLTFILSTAAFTIQHESQYVQNQTPRGHRPTPTHIVLNPHPHCLDPKGDNACSLANKRRKRTRLRKRS